MSQSVFFSKLNPSQNGQSILLLCHDNPPEVSIIARFCTNFIFENIWGGSRPPTIHTDKHMRNHSLHKIFEDLIPNRMVYKNKINNK